MTDSGRVIDLRTRSTYQPDCAALARTRVLMARRSLGLTPGEFAAMLTPMVGWDVTPNAVEAWETTAIPPGDVLVAVSSITPAETDQLGVRSHKFIASYIGPDAAARLAANPQSRPRQARAAGAYRSLPADGPPGQCDLHVWPFGVAIFHLVEELRVPSIAQLALWRYRSYEENLAWAADYLQQAAGTSGQNSYVLSLYWVHTPIWAGRITDTAIRIICSPRVLVERDLDDPEGCLSTAERAERTLLAKGFEHGGMHEFGVASVSIGYASWSGVAYHPVDPARALAEDELVACELAVQAMWSYCGRLNAEVEAGREPDVPDEYGWRFLRAARSQLVNPRPQETGQHRAMREAILTTSDLVRHLEQAIEVLRESER